MYVDQSVAGLKYKMCVLGLGFHWVKVCGQFFAISSIPSLDLSASSLSSGMLALKCLSRRSSAIVHTEGASVLNVA